MTKVYVVGIGQTPVREHWDRSARDLAVSSVLEAIEQAGVEKADAIYVGNALSGEVAGQEHLAALVADFAGMAGTEAVRIEAAGASGAAAVRMGCLAVASGLQEVVIVTGVEKMSDLTGPAVEEALVTATDEEYEAIHGLSLVALNALLMRRYIYEHHVERSDFAHFSINAHKNASNNEYAMFRRPITVDAFVNARMIADPISLLDSAPVADGAASLVLCSEKVVGERANSAVEIVASAAATDAMALHDRGNPLFLQGVYESAQRAYAQAGIGPEDIDLFELHDAFTIMGALSLEGCGFASEGEGVRLGIDGEIALEGRIPISTMGGLKGRGHPVGATGVYQVVELVQQLRGEAGANQVDGRLGMAQSIGGSGATVVTHILKSP
ncbi:MAG: acetyl-CoA acetyltransferase [Chloroflexi bacterium B3_Chlor]|nr:MAG: acetyl-CoA acetyltransferase [Chloroflexi bacterium B3_Chlor]